MSHSLAVSLLYFCSHFVFQQHFVVCAVGINLTKFIMQSVIFSELPNLYSYVRCNL